MVYTVGSGGQTDTSGGTFAGTGTGAIATANGLSAKLASLGVVLQHGDPALAKTIRQHGQDDLFGPQVPAGDVNTTIAGAIQSMIDWDPAMVEDLQRRMYAAGPGVFYSKAYYSKTNATPIVPGEPQDAGTVRAFEMLLRRAAQTKGAKTPDEILDGLVAEMQKQGKNYSLDDQTGTATPPTKVSSPDDIRAAVAQAATNIYGHGASGQLVDKIVAAFQAQQAGEQSQYASGQDTTAAPTAQNFAEAQLQQADPTEAGVNNYLNAYSAFDALLKKTGK